MRPWHKPQLPQVEIASRSSGQPSPAIASASTVAVRLAVVPGADFVKTSTGKTPRGATPDAARAMLLSPRDPWIEMMNVTTAHSHFFLGRYDDAKAMYLNVRDEKRSADGKRIYADEIRDDFVLLRKRGLAVPDMERMARELKL